MKPNKPAGVLFTPFSTKWRASFFPGGLRAGVGVSGLLALGSFSLTHAEIEVARGTLTLQAQMEQQYDSNIFANSSQVGDWISVLTPFADFKREAGKLNLDAQAGAMFQHFAKTSDLDNADPFGRIEIKAPRLDGKFDGFAEVGARRVEEADPLVNARTKFWETGVRGGAGIYPVEKLGLRTEASYFDRNYLIENMSDIRTTTINSDVVFVSSPKVNFFAGVGARWVDTYHVPVVLAPMDSEDLKVRVGMEGEIGPKLTGQISGGWVQRRFRITQGGEISGLLFDTSLVFRPDDETSVTFHVKRDFDTTPIDQSVMQLSSGFDIRRTFRQKLAATTGFEYLHRNIIGIGVSRRDDVYVIRETLDYTLSRRFTASLISSYNRTRSDKIFSQYSRYILGVSLTAIF